MDEVSASQDTCSLTVSVPITNVSLGGGIIRRGLSMSLGTPPQSMAMLPKW